MSKEGNEGEEGRKRRGRRGEEGKEPTEMRVHIFGAEMVSHHLRRLTTPRVGTMMYFAILIAEFSE